MKFVGVIPARYGSTRFLGKPLKLISGKALIEWVIRGSQQSKMLNQLIVATDHEQIAELAKKCQCEVVMTDSNLPTGTDRVWQAVKNLDCDVVLNIQGDEPLVTGDIIDSLALSMKSDTSAQMATLSTGFKNRDELINPNIVKVLSNQKGDALYFSRFEIPYSRQKITSIQDSVSQRHIGMYAFRKNFLKDFCTHPQSPIEVAESLEQLRALDMGAKIKVVKTNYDCIGVDHPEDIEKVERILRER